MAKSATVDIRKDGDATVFTVTPGGARRLTSLITSGVFFMCVGWAFQDGLGWVAWPVITGGAITLILGLRDHRPPSHRIKSVIRVSPSGFDVNGRVYARDLVKRLLVRNPLQTDEPARTIVFSGPTASSVQAQIDAHEAGRREWAALAEGAYEIILDAEHKDTVIAGNLDSRSVDRLLRSLCDESGMTYREA